MGSIAGGTARGSVAPFLRHRRRRQASLTERTFTEVSIAVTIRHQRGQFRPFVSKIVIDHAMIRVVGSSAMPKRAVGKTEPKLSDLVPRLAGSGARKGIAKSL